MIYRPGIAGYYPRSYLGAGIGYPYGGYAFPYFGYGYGWGYPGIGYGYGYPGYYGISGGLL